jgi:hypothetical protein
MALEFKEKILLDRLTFQIRFYPCSSVAHFSSRLAIHYLRFTNYSLESARLKWAPRAASVMQLHRALPRNDVASPILPLRFDN